MWPEGQRDGLGEYCTSKVSKRSRERGLLKAEPSPALERGQYEKQMDHHWRCRSECFVWRRRNSRTFLQPDQMEQKRSQPDGKRTARREQIGRQDANSAIPAPTHPPPQTEPRLPENQ